MLGSIFFCLALLIAIPTNQAQDLVTSTCDKTLYKDYCKSVLGSASASDLAGLTKFALNAASSKVTEIHSEIKKLSSSASDAAVKQILTDCSTNYGDAADQIVQSTAAVATKGFSDINIWMSAAMTSGDTCEQGFTEKKVTSPLTSLNTQFKQLCSIILTMSNLANA